jgi:arylsulfatase A-like enzyme
MDEKNYLSRRELLKGLSLLPAFYFWSKANQNTNGSEPNILILVFDAWSGFHLPTYGYARNTTPNLNKLLDRAIIYHNHYATGNFTTPGTASLLTGVYPWTHRTFNINGRLPDEFIEKNIFALFDSYNRIAYTHNPYVDNFLLQFENSLENLTPRHDLYLNYDPLVDDLLINDWDVAVYSKRRIIGLSPSAQTTSIYLKKFLFALEAKTREAVKDKLNDLFPRGLPSIEDLNYFTLEDSVNWVISQLSTSPQPFLGYFHFFPPHAPYRTRIEFNGTFRNDVFQPPIKPEHLFSKGYSKKTLRSERRRYDEFILYLDSELDRLIKNLEQKGVLENTWIILTSDHGELFERGILAHSGETLFEPVIKIPLLIFEPDRKQRLDVYQPTSAVDILPTLMHLTNQAVPAWAEGEVLPPYASAPPQPRSIFALDAKQNRKFAPLTTATSTIIQDNHKLIYYTGYEELSSQEMFEFYDLGSDPEELNNLAPSKPKAMSDLLEILKEKINKSDQNLTKNL